MAVYKCEGCSLDFCDTCDEISECLECCAVFCVACMPNGSIHSCFEPHCQHCNRTPDEFEEWCCTEAEHEVVTTTRQREQTVGERGVW